jgi:transcriptional regulator with XRE-family HTH domain
VAISEEHFAENLRRLAGMHLLSFERLAAALEMSRPAVMHLVAVAPENRSVPRTATAMRVAELFGVPLDMLYAEPRECLAAAVESFEEAPAREWAAVPRLPMADALAAAKAAGVPVRMVPARRKRGGGARRRK